MMANQRATKKQQELLQFIDGFIKGHGYGPSYREVMRALGYKSVSTVAAHVDQLIIKGYIEKKDNSARSLEVVTLRPAKDSVQDDAAIKAITQRMHQLQDEGKIEAANVLQEALEILQTPS